MALSITSISSDLSPLGVWAAARQDKLVLSSSGGVRGTHFVFLMALVMKGGEESQKVSMFTPVHNSCGNLRTSGSMLSLPIQYGLAIYPLQLGVWSIII